jgi:hypothetical protein
VAVVVDGYFFIERGSEPGLSTLTETAESWRGVVEKFASELERAERIPTQKKRSACASNQVKMLATDLIPFDLSKSLNGVCVQSKVIVDLREYEVPECPADHTAEVSNLGVPVTPIPDA